MEVEFDARKNAENIRKHGISFQRAEDFDMDSALIKTDNSQDYGEVRRRAFAEVEGKWFQCVYTLRGDVRHIITVHRINEKRVKRWLSR